MTDPSEYVYPRVHYSPDVTGACRLPVGPQRDLTGHVGDLTTSQFFPSGQVILSGATDMQIKIWGLDGSNAVTLKGHKRGEHNAAL